MAYKPRMAKDVFGYARDPISKLNQTVFRYTFANGNKYSFQIITFGATITSIRTPDANGIIRDIVLGYENLDGYASPENPYIGCTVGRVCNRIGNAKFELNGKVYKLTRNFMNKHQIHGGHIGFDKLLWYVQKVRIDGIDMCCISPDGHEGFPGEVTCHARFSLRADNSLTVDYEACCTKPTPINLCNHSYFNLAGHNTGAAALYDHMALIKGSKILERDKETIPTGALLDVVQTPYDFRDWKNFGEGIKEIKPAPGYDDTYVLDLDRQKTLTMVARVHHPISGRTMEISTNQPVMHLYTAHNMPDIARGARATIIGKCDTPYERHSSFCLEPSGYVDAVNHENFPSIIVQPGEIYKHRTVYKFSANAHAN